MSDPLSIISSETALSAPATVLLGEQGEKLAAEFLRCSGYRIVVTNFKVPVGRNRNGAQVTGEIDIVALDGETLCFIEVKTRRSDEFTPVITAVDIRKQRQITRTSKVYRRVFDIRGIEYRFDVVTVLLAKGEDPVIELTRGFWNEADFRKRTWSYNAWNEFA